MPDDEGAATEGASTGATARRAPRFSWTPAFEETFFRSLCDSVSLGLRENNTFKPEAWDRAIAALRDAHGAHASKSHLINKADNARKRFRMWRGLREDARFFYDPVTRCVTGTEDDWRAHLEKEPLARALRGRPFEFEQYLQLLYPDVVGSGGVPRRVTKPKRRQDGEPSADDAATTNIVFLEPDTSTMPPQGKGAATPQPQPSQPPPSTQATTPFSSSPQTQLSQMAQMPQPLLQTQRLAKAGRTTASAAAAPDSNPAAALTPPDETSHGRKRGLSVSNAVADMPVTSVPAKPSLLTPSSSTTPTAASAAAAASASASAALAAAAASRLAVPATAATTSASSSTPTDTSTSQPPEKRRRSNAAPRTTPMASTPTFAAPAHMVPAAAPLAADATTPAADPNSGPGGGAGIERVLGEHRVLLERMLHAVQTQLAPRWSEQAMDIFLRDFADEDMDLQVKIAEKVLADDNKAMVFCKFSPCLRSHWVKRLRELINSRPSQ